MSLSKIKKYIINEFMPALDNVDGIIGQRADNSYFTVIRRFISGELSLRKFSDLVYKNNLCKQLVFISEKIINTLDFKYAENIDYNNYYQRVIYKDLNIQNQLINSADFDYIFINDIIKDKWRNDDSRLRRMLH